MHAKHEQEPQIEMKQTRVSHIAFRARSLLPKTSGCLKYTSMLSWEASRLELGELNGSGFKGLGFSAPRVVFHVTLPTTVAQQRETTFHMSVSGTT